VPASWTTCSNLPYNGLVAVHRPVGLRSSGWRSPIALVGERQHSRRGPRRQPTSASRPNSRTAVSAQQPVSRSPDLSTAYTVRLPVFEGPLDLLLHLIEERELDITTVSLAAVTGQYLDHISRVEKLESEKLADFLIIAAKLLLIKSRMLLPQPPVEAEDEAEEDVGDELVRRLIEYRRFKDAAQELRLREEHGLRAYARLLPAPQPGLAVRLEGATLDALVLAVQQALESKTTSSADDVITPLQISLPDKIAHLESLLEKHRSYSFSRILEQAVSRMEIIVTFLALLQLIKRRKVVVEQSELFGEIMLSMSD